MWLREIFAAMNDYPWTTFFLFIMVCAILGEMRGFITININRK